MTHAYPVSSQALICDYFRIVLAKFPFPTSLPDFMRFSQITQRVRRTWR